MTSTKSRHELAAFLRARRERTSPGDVGLPPGGRRRTPGLRREELAALAGISTTWYTFLEQGRDVRASRQVLDAIAHGLRLGDAERAHLRALGADEDVPAVESETVSPEVAGVPAMVEPNPAYVTGRTFDLLAWNDAAVRWFRGAWDGPAPNLARWVFTDPSAREVLPEWPLVAQGVLARLRANAGRHPGSARFAELERELRAASPEADAWWPRYDIATSQSGVKRVRTPSGEERRLTYASFQVSDQPDQVLTIYRPA
ncbi:helix-turn-helix transcriptional regulator [Microlunatus flavus]|uniref:Helix-turn-helix domain-containing protein n=1 Tax=Microlunatus flavus TaxID=1036181 RepID=A0A1H9H0I3_9ACTN|nr:helix-turn-helix transcriptional regulator [Microlunatus flavus]SEQ55876.1 Helix-turn-helix domain-containing protein [Microlunatus flavus]